MCCTRLWAFQPVQHYSAVTRSWHLQHFKGWLILMIAQLLEVASLFCESVCGRATPQWVWARGSTTPPSVWSQGTRLMSSWRSRLADRRETEAGRLTIPEMEPGRSERDFPRWAGKVQKFVVYTLRINRCNNERMAFKAFLQRRCFRKNFKIVRFRNLILSRL